MRNYISVEEIIDKWSGNGPILGVVEDLLEKQDQEGEPWIGTFTFLRQYLWPSDKEESTHRLIGEFIESPETIEEFWKGLEVELARDYYYEIVKMNIYLDIGRWRYSKNDSFRLLIFYKDILDRLIGLGEVDWRSDKEKTVYNLYKEILKEIMG